MPLSIIGAGFGRTGTMSLYAALNQLGFPCYHLFANFRKAAINSNLAFWRRVANSPDGCQHDWEKVFAGYTACVDNPASCVWRELATAYPQAKIILTVHPKGPEAWYESTVDTNYFFTGNSWQFRVLEIATPLGTADRRDFTQADLAALPSWHNDGASQGYFPLPQLY
jgi:hypothetical protein